MSNNKIPKSFGIWGNTDKDKFWEFMEERGGLDMPHFHAAEVDIEQTD